MSDILKYIAGACLCLVFKWKPFASQKSTLLKNKSKPDLLAKIFVFCFFFVDFDECASGENYCSQWATCTNTWASYMCVCKDGFIDNNSQRPGQSCQGSVSQSHSGQIIHSNNN